MYKKTLFIIAILFLSLNANTLLKTGQIQSYDVNGNVVAYGTIKDDGYYQSGATRNYSRNGNIVIDNTTRLQWQDDEEAESMTKYWITRANWDAKNYNDTTGDTATTYCSMLSMESHDDWRIPSVEELETIVDYSQDKPNVSAGIFQNIYSDPYWTSTNYVRDNKAIWGVNFKYTFSDANTKQYPSHVRCVRGLQLSDVNLSRNDNKVVSDTTTKLQWQDDSVVKTEYRSWNEAIEYCETLILDNSSDWRLPNINELLSIVDRSTYYPAVDSAIFKNTHTSTYWSSTTKVSETDKAFSINFYNGDSSSTLKSLDGHVRCVRDNFIHTPLGVVASDGEFELTVDINWSSVANIDYYEVYRSESRYIIGTIVGTSITNSFVDDTIQKDIKYYYRIKACNNNECSEYSNIDSGYIGNIMSINSTTIIMFLLN